MSRAMNRGNKKQGLKRPSEIAVTMKSEMGLLNCSLKIAMETDLLLSFEFANPHFHSRRIL